MRIILLISLTLLIISGSFEVNAEIGTFAPDGLRSPPPETEYRVPGGHPLLFCGEEFMAVLVVGSIIPNLGFSELSPPSLIVIRKKDIEEVQLVLESGARIFFYEDSNRETNRYSIDTWTDARAILECLD